jgi:hypothetical protein
MVSPLSLCIAPLIQASTQGAGLQWWHPSETARPAMLARNGSLPTTCTARRGRTDSPFKITDQSCFEWECSIAQANSQAWQPTHFRGSQNRRSIAPPWVDLVTPTARYLPLLRIQPTVLGSGTSLQRDPVVKSHIRSPRQRLRTNAPCPEASRAAHCMSLHAAWSSCFCTGCFCTGTRALEVKSCMALPPHLAVYAHPHPALEHA